MEGLELICFEMIAANGSARSFFMEALAAAKEGNFEEADRLMSEGEAMLEDGHHAHGNLLSQEASGDKVKVDLLLIHAEDQMMSAETFKIMAGEMIEIYSRLK
ncbi:MAG TPA: PTS lactose/cellobiose transporter subunit IIA [Bacteroidales bacterium]|nr:PTS lactose/cellobiose transporter subunit IIA [Bacteroidales bacterium]